MKRYLLLLIVTVFWAIVGTANAKEWTIETRSLRSISFDIPDTYKCVYHCDSINNGLIYVFEKDGAVLSIDEISIDNFDQKKAKKMPNALLIPNSEIIDSEEPLEGPISRIIVSKTDSGSTIRHYVYFNPDGIIIMNASTNNSVWNEIDQIANTFESHFKWSKFLLFILVGLIGIIPSIIIAKALDYRKKNLQKFWCYIITALIIILALTIIYSIWRSVGFWMLLLGYLLCSVGLGYVLGRGMTIIF